MPDIVTTVCAVVLLLFVLRGAWRGITGELAPLAGLVACGGILWFGYTPLKALLATRFAIQPDALTFYAALGILFLGGTAFFLVGHLIRKIGEWVIPQPFNAILGALIGGAKAVVIIGLVMGSIQVIKDKINKTFEASEENPVSAAALTFWKDRFLPDLSGGFSIPRLTNPETEDPKPTDPANGLP